MVYVESPLIQSPFFDNSHPVFLKLENTQPTGSFKSRGMTALVEEEVKSNPRSHFYSSSGGNAGLAVAEAAFSQGSPSTIVVPTVTPAKVLEKMRKWRATVILHGSNWPEADAHLQGLLAKDPNGVYCHPFDNPKIWDGHATLVDELKEQLGGQAPGAIVLSAGGAGLFCGVMRGLIRNSWTHVPVYVVETEGASCFNQSVIAGKKVVTAAPNSIAKSLGSTWVPQQAIDYAEQYSVKSILVTDDQTLRVVKKFATWHNFIVEPACGATLAAIDADAIDVQHGPVVGIVCGGSLYSGADVA